MTGSLNAPAKPEFILSHGSGAYVYTTEGRRLLDVILGAGSLLLGHCAPPIVDAVGAQIARGTVFTHVTPPVIELARQVVEAVPGAQKARFMNCGSEAALCALRLVRAYSGKERILKFAGAYHGFGDQVIFNTNYGHPEEWAAAPQATVDTAGVPAGEAGLVLVTPYNDLDRAAEIIGEHHAELAGVFVEPMMRGLAPLPGFLEGIAELARRYHLPLVFDEVGTGFRLAYGGAQAYYGITADLAIFGKALGAGYPIGAITGGDELMSYLDPASPDERRIYSLGSFYGNALVAAAAVANLTELRKPGVYEHLGAYGEGLRHGLKELFGRFGLPIQVMGAGNFAEFFITDEPITDYLSTRRTNLRLKGQWGAELIRHGVFGGAGRFNSCTCHGQLELDLFLGASEESLRALKRAGAF